MTGIGNGSISASFSANSSPTPRTATVTVTGGGFTHQVTITQAGNSNPNCSNDNEPANNSMSTAPSIALGADKQSQIGSNIDTDFWKFTLNSSQSTTITLSTLPADYDLALFNSSGAQLAASANGGSSNETITINLAAGTYCARVIGYNGVFSTSQCYTLRVNTQTVSLELSPATQKVGSGAGTASLSVTGNVSWTATDNASRLSLSPGSGTGNGAITASFSANTTSSARTATVTVTGGGFTRTATITQAGVVAACNPPGNPNTVSITQNTATLQWSSAPGYQVQFLLSNVWTNVGAPTTFLSMDIYGLLPGASYSWRVITICAGNQQSAPSASVTFTATPAAANCPGGVQSPAFALNPTGSWQYQSLPGGGRYMVVNVQSGVRYVFSGCPSDGAVIPFDGQLSVRNMSDQLISYSDDVCGTAPRIIWRASFTGQVRVLLTKYSSQTENSAGTLAYRIDNSFTGEGTEDRDASPAYAALPAPDAPVRTEWVDTDANGDDALLLTASPNPAKSQFLVQCAYAGEAAQARLQVMDLSGRLYQEDTLTLVRGANAWRVTVDNWPPNLYLVRLLTEDGKTAICKVLIVP
jgi:hypothetical protein